MEQPPLFAHGHWDTLADSKSHATNVLTRTSRTEWCAANLGFVGIPKAASGPSWTSHRYPRASAFIVARTSRRGRTREFLVVDKSTNHFPQAFAQRVFLLPWL